MDKMKPGQETKAKYDKDADLIDMTIAGVPGQMCITKENAKLLLAELQRRSTRQMCVIKENAELLLAELQRRSICWCAPKRCHAQTISDYLLGKLYVDK